MEYGLLHRADSLIAAGDLPPMVIVLPEGEQSYWVNHVDGAPGRRMRSLKSVLGTTLIDETTRLGRQRTGFRDVIAK